MRIVPTAGVVFAGALLLASCAGTGNPAGAGGPKNYVDGATFSTSLGADPGNLDPLRAESGPAAIVDAFGYDTLVNMDHQGRPVPQLATKWEVTPNSVTYTLHKGVTCVDGSPLTATQVAANFEYIRNPANQSPLIGNNLPDANFTVRADDAASTVTIATAQPFGFLLTGAGTVPIVCAKGTADRGKLAHGTDGTGPYRLTEAVAEDHYTFEVRKDYAWGPNGAKTDAPGTPAKVVLKIVQSESTAANLLLSGQLNGISVLGQDRQRLAGHGYHEMQVTSSPNTLYFNQRPNHPGADPAVRSALTAGLDLDQLTKVLTENNGRRATNLEPNEPRPCDYDSVTGTLPGHDVEAAKSALDKAGWVPGQDGVRAKNGQRLAITLLYSAGSPANDAGMELVSNWWKPLGAEVKLAAKELTALNQELFVNGDTWDATVFGIGVSYPSQLVGYLSGAKPPAGTNFSAIDNAEYANLSGQAGKTPGDAGCALWQRAEQALLRAGDVVPVSTGLVHYFGNKATYQPGIWGLEPTSIRMVAS
ncbi:ABC transporter substrate-binding protein [Amycolatopsis sp. CA-230715]|uniref:ABC transporter substrate-binding protein n=1 Tax=Amycolatopsis sp. CA-230715 TaxID=2745196 RepID=UPI001C01944F|nr:ABC transporter substrate-binding protein [Amycolatopsis sp. CA-230715]QWF83533.1 putative deoxycholate-binding periplasmic protein YgiS [Amycolatopsis sp. CA-230715]